MDDDEPLQPEMQPLLSGKTIIMVLHDLELALEYSDHLILLEQGKVICTGSPQELITCGMLERVLMYRPA